MSSSASHMIKKREKPNDVFITPLDLAKKHIDYLDANDDDVWYDPFKNTGSYYNQYPTNNKKWSEILDGKDFFEFDEPVDIICSNPPYSFIDDVLKKSVALKPRIISYLIGQGNLTARRIEYMNNNGYGLKKLLMCKVFKWYGMSYVVVFEKGSDDIVDIDRKVYK